MPKMPPSRVKIYAGLAAACLAQDDGDGLLLCYRMWTVARAIDKQGGGWITVQELVDAWPQSKRTIRDVLTRPAGQYFWTLYNTGRGTPANKQRVFLRGLETVCVNVGANTGASFWLSYTDTHTLKSFKAICYAASFAGRDEPVIISRTKLSEKFGATRQTLRNYEKAAGVEISYNVGRMSESAYQAQQVAAWETGSAGLGWTRPDVYHLAGHVYFQLPNGYTAEISRAARPRRTARRVYHTLLSGGANDRLDRRYERVFWYDELAAYKAASKGKTGKTYFVKTDKKLSKCAVWAYYEAFA